jgi:hypothetical protein
MRKNVAKTKEEIVNEVMELNTLRKQLILKKERVIEDYCISISPYKIGDKFTDDNGSVFLISKIMPDYYIFDKKYGSSSNYPFYYFGCTLKKDGTPKKNGNIFTRYLENHPELKDKIIKEDASKNLQITKEEIINEVLELSKRIKQLDLKKDRVIIKYCISKSLYKRGDKFIDKYGTKIIIEEIFPRWNLFEEKYYGDVPDIFNYPFYYRGRNMKQDGTPKKKGWATAYYDGEQPEK